MKKLFLIAAACIIANISSAQIVTNLAMVNMPPGTLTDWDNKTLTYLVGGQPGLTLTVLIKTEIKTISGTVVATTNLTKARQIVISGSNLIFYVNDVMPLDIMMFNGKYKTSIERSGKLPADNYQLCVQLVNPTDYRPMSEVRCRNFNVAAFQLPIPMLPANEEVIEAEKAQTAITFRWTPVTPSPPTPVRYVVTVFEVLDKQTPMQALRSNQPLLTKEIMGTTQYIWQPQLSFIKTKVWGDPHEYDNDEWAKRMDSIDATTFIWTIQTFDVSGRPFGDGNVNADGISEPNVFTVIKDRRQIRSGIPAKTIYLDYIRTKRN